MKKWQGLALAAVLVIGILCAAFFLAPRETPQSLALPEPTETPERTGESAVPPEASASSEAAERTSEATEPERTQPTEPTAETPQSEPTETQPPKTQPPETEPSETQPPETEPPVPACTICITCADVLTHMEELAEGKRSIVPESGWMLGSVSVPLAEGDTVFDILQRVTRQYGIAMEFSVSPLYQTAYVEGIGNLYERDCGPTSGWIYTVNGNFPSYGCSDYTVQDGDSIVWSFRCTQ